MQLVNLREVVFYPYTTVATIAHKKKSANDIFKIARFAWGSLPESFKGLYDVKYDTVRELEFASNGSRYFVDLEARGTTMQKLHISEAAFISGFDEIVASTFETIPKNGSITVESTANGFNNFYDFWNDAVIGRSGFKPHFYNWTWDDLYREVAPEGNWRNEYEELSREYGLITNIKDTLGLDDDQFYWYFLKARLLKSLVKQEYPCTAEEAFLSENSAVFDLYKVAQIIASRIVDTSRGVRLYETPQEGKKYIIGIDTAEGLGGDSTAMVILNADDMKVAGVFNDDTIRPDQVADLAVRMAQVFNNAFIIPERNSSGLSTVLKLQEIGYNRLYRDRTIDKITKKAKDQLGWRTTKQSRDLMIDDFVEVFETGSIDVSDFEIIGQMKTFVRKDNGKREHEEGKHDDLLFALFLCVQGLKYYRADTAFIDFYKNEYGNNGQAQPSILEAYREGGAEAIRLPS